MKINRSQNAARNIIFGVLVKIYSLFVPFIIRTVMIYTLGMQYLGLNSLFVSVLSVLNLAELGVGGAMVFSMYKPIAEDDKDTICALMRLYKIYYRIIGLAILVIGLLLTPFIPKLISGTLPEGMNVYILYLMNLASTVITYWLFAYKNCLLSAHQRSDITHKINMVIITVQYGVQIVVLVVLKNYYIYIMILFLFSAIENIVRALVVDKLYPQYRAGGKLPRSEIKKINQRVRDLFTSKIGSIIVDSVDTIIISAFLGLTALAIYQNYFYVITSITGFVTVIFASCTAGIGNSIVTETKEKNYNDLKKFMLIISWISGFCICCFACLYQPFMELWVGKENMLSFSFVVCLCVYFFVKQINSLLNLYKDAAGIWHEDRFRPLVTALTNLGMNLVMVQFWGLYGILLSTVLSMLIVGMPWLLHNLFTVLFRKSAREFLVKMLQYMFVSAIVCAVCVGVCSFIKIGLIPTIIIRGIICCILSNIVFYIIYRRFPEFEQVKALVLAMLPRKLVQKLSFLEKL